MKTRTRNLNDNYKQIFIDKDEFNGEYDKSKEQGYFTERAGELIITLTENIILSNRFRHLRKMNEEVKNLLFDYVLMFIMEKGLRYHRIGGNAFSYTTSLVISQGNDFMRARFGKHRRLDLYGSRIKYIGDDGNWQTAAFVSFNELNLN